MTRYRRLLSALILAAIATITSPAFPQTVYNDDADGRRLAAIKFDRVEDGSAVRLRLVISAVGPEVEPISGFEGIGGANRFTAEQFASLLAGSQRFLVRSRNVETGEIAIGEFRAGRTGFVPMRHVRADGSIDYLARWPRELPLELVVETGSLGIGRYETELRVDGMPRARVIATVAARGEVALERFESLGGHEGGNDVASPVLASRSKPNFLQVLDVAEQAPAAPPVKPVDVDLDEWAKRDMEGKWALYQRWIAPSPALREGWVPFLVAQKDYAFLEWLGLYQPDGFSSQGVGKALADAGAPQWARAAHWMRNNSVGHGERAGLSAFRSRPREALWWLRKYPEAANDLKDLVAEFEKQKIEPLESPHLLPPLKAQDVFGLLEAPADVSAFGDRLTGETGKTYEQQVIRAIRGYITVGQPTAEWDAKLRALLRHANVPVRREAYLAYTHPVVGVLEVEHVAPVIDDVREPATVRESAALAFSYADHPMVYVRLNRIARDVNHPAWPAAVSRLGDLGDGFSLSILETLKHPRASQDKLLDDSRERIRTRVTQEKANLAGNQIQVESIEWLLCTQLARIAWAEKAADPLAKELKDWTIGEARKAAAAHKSVLAAVGHIAGANDAARPVNAPKAAAWTVHADRVRLLAAEIIVQR